MSERDNNNTPTFLTPSRETMRFVLLSIWHMQIVL